MQIDGISYYDFYKSFAGRVSNPREVLQDIQEQNDYAPGAIVNISQQARDYQDKIKADGELQEIAAAEKLQGCQTCKDRKYVDESDDPSVSFQTPQSIQPSQSFSMVRAHEYEHVSNEQAKAQREDRKIVSQTVSLSMSICPECGKAYISGGVTRTVSKSDNKPEMPNEPPSSASK